MNPHRHAIDTANSRHAAARTRVYVGRPQRLDNHTYIAPGATNDLTPLLRFHYLPHLPATTRAIWRAMDKRSGRLIGVIAIGYPTIRSHAREAVFGLLTPHLLNERFSQLQRLIVRPNCGQHGLAHALLRHAIKHSPTRVLEATNQPTVPSALFTDCGFMLFPTTTANYYYHALLQSRPLNALPRPTRT